MLFSSDAAPPISTNIDATTICFTGPGFIDGVFMFVGMGSRVDVNDDGDFNDDTNGES
jgi:hypothetical protein